MNLIQTTEVTILRAMANTRRDLTNNLIRSKAKLMKVKACEVRKEQKKVPNPIEKLQMQNEMTKRAQ